MNCSCLSIHLLKLSSCCHMGAPSQSSCLHGCGSCLPLLLSPCSPLHSPIAASIIFIKHKSSHAVPMLQTLKAPVTLRIMVLSILTIPCNSGLLCPTFAPFTLSCSQLELLPDPRTKRCSLLPLSAHFLLLRLEYSPLFLPHFSPC